MGEMFSELDQWYKVCGVDTNCANVTFDLPLWSEVGVTFIFAHVFFNEVGM